MGGRGSSRLVKTLPRLRHRHRRRENHEEQERSQFENHHQLQQQQQQHHSRPLENPVVANVAFDQASARNSRNEGDNYGIANDDDENDEDEDEDSRDSNPSSGTSSRSTGNKVRPDKTGSFGNLKRLRTVRSHVRTTLETPTVATSYL